MERAALVNGAYLLATVLFIVGLKGLAHPRTAVRGNLLGALGMMVAIVVTLFDRGIVRFEWIIVGLIVGSLIGLLIAMTIQVTAMPQLVALFNGFGGAASALVAGGVIYRTLAPTGGELQFGIAAAASGLIGAVTLFGSLIAFGKLQGLVSEKPLRYPGEQIVKGVCFVATLALSLLFVLHPGQTSLYWYLIAVSSLLGILLVMPIGGADMPIVIALLNSYSGLAATATGFVLSNTALIIAGSLVGASGIILSHIMCKAMNRSLPNVLFGGVGEIIEIDDQDDFYAGKVKASSAEEIASLLKSVRRVVFVPGYGMAVARAQTPVRVLTEMMERDGITVEFGIHPVAGRMPGHMNVLLAEENIAYDKLRDLDQSNLDFPQTDMVIVLGANDVVNPLAREASGSPISGMPILNVDQARMVVVIKRSLSPGFAGIANPLFAAENTLMLFGDGKEVMEGLIVAYREA